MKVKMNQLVRWSNDTVATPRQMLDNGQAEIVKYGNFKASNRGKPRKAIFVNLKGTMFGVEVSGYVE